MKHYLSGPVVLLVLLFAACETPTGGLPDARLLQDLPKNARTVEHLFVYSEEKAVLNSRGAAVDFRVDEITPSVYDVRVYYEEFGGWVQLPYTLAGDYCGDLIDLGFVYRPGTVTLTITPNTLQPSTRILPPPTRIKVVTVSPGDA